MSSGKGGFSPGQHFGIVLPIPKAAMKKSNEAVAERA
jgi:hypothetical protein